MNTLMFRAVFEGVVKKQPYTGSLRALCCLREAGDGDGADCIFHTKSRHVHVTPLSVFLLDCQV